ncbi:MAG: S8 family serine peptidase [Dehalococcoidia bacterium]|nr:S8 family serine peptidase [Dehalococcoidia bacterium]
MAKLLGVFIALLLASAFALQQDSGAIEARPAGLVAVPGKYIVVLQPGVDAASVAIGHGAIPEQAYSHALNGFAGQLSPRQVAALRADSRVLSIEQDQVVSIAVQTVPTGIQRIGAPGNGAIDIDGTDDFRVDVDVAVIDTGIDASHPDLNWFSSVNCSGGAPWKSSCGSGGADDNGHGTHVAGTIGALDNGIGVVGVAPGARLWAVKVLNSQGSGYMSWIVAGIDYVAKNAGAIEVANMSLGCECASAAMNTAISNAVGKGVVFVVAAGNNGKDAGTFSPANHDDVITVSAVADFDGLPGSLADQTVSWSSCTENDDDSLACFSNFGGLINIAAPGVLITSTWPGGGYNTISGTSMASPHVAGAAALLASRNNPNNAEDVGAIRSALIDAGNFDWIDDSGDGFKEPLLDVSNTTVFNPVMVPGSGGGGGGTPPDAPPTVSITSPTGGATVSGTVNVVAAASDDNGVTQVEFFVDGTPIGVDTSSAGGWSVSWDTTAYANSGHSLTAVATDTASQTANSAAVTVNVSNSTPGGDPTVLTAALSGSAVNNGSTWTATATVTVRDGSGNQVGGALVTGKWNGSESASCTTSSLGMCSVSRSQAKKVASVTFEVTGVALTGYTYDDANPTVVISKP